MGFSHQLALRRLSTHSSGLIGNTITPLIRLDRLGKIIPGHNQGIGVGRIDIVLADTRFGYTDRNEDDSQRGDVDDCHWQKKTDVFTSHLPANRFIAECPVDCTSARLGAVGNVEYMRRLYVTCTNLSLAPAHNQ